MKLSRILLYSGVAIVGVTSVLSWQRSNATATAQRRTTVMATDQRGAAMPLAVPNAIAAAPTPPQVTSPAPTTPVPPASPSPAPQPESPYFKPSPSPTLGNPGSVLTISNCNGQAGNANLRSEPRLAHETILGVVPQGQAVKLTGRAAIRDGEFWYEAIALSPLAASNNTLAANTGVGQQGMTGWIFGCFVNGEGQ
ncbi:SH3 domain-containing protein [Leptolyngbya ohadii]|uniref:SH3 domain-containing protein n=1 Tax=Leptolyngbya ohadii TaxID=1962290 RepID=UPI00117A2766|nr:SH3 domain-containing protein [Leptolyngbya ohadii]